MALFLKILWDYRKVAIWTLIVAVVALTGWRVSEWLRAYKELDFVKAQLVNERACGEGSECDKRQKALEAAHIETNAKVVGSYEAELAAVRNRPARVVRVCTDPGNVQGAGPAGASDGAGPAAGVVSGPAGPDIGGRLYDLAREADEVAARLRALQEWNRSLAAD
jgi:hypothetical protein